MLDTHFYHKYIEKDKKCEETSNVFWWCPYSNTVETDDRWRAANSLMAIFWWRTVYYAINMNTIELCTMLSMIYTVSAI